jgi:hypothetical protein
VFGGLNRLLAVAVVAGAILALPPAAFANCGGNPSAVNVYKECLPSGGGGKATGQSGTSSNGAPGSTSVPISNQTAKALKSAGQDQKPLTNLVKGLGAARLLQSHDSATGPSAVGSAFDVGSGPTALLIVLACTAILLLAATGVRGVRQRRG